MAWDDGIGRLVDAGVTGTILLANMGSVKGLSVRAVLLVAHLFVYTCPHGGHDVRKKQEHGVSRHDA